MESHCQSQCGEKGAKCHGFPSFHRRHSVAAGRPQRQTAASHVRIVQQLEAEIGRDYIHSQDVTRKQVDNPCTYVSIHLPETPSHLGSKKAN